MSLIFICCWYDIRGGYFIVVVFLDENVTVNILFSLIFCIATYNNKKEQQQRCNKNNAVVVVKVFPAINWP